MIFILLIIAFVFGWNVYHWIMQRWLNLPPGPVGLPILGNLLSLSRRAEISLSKMAEKFGPVFTVYLGSNRTVVLNSIEAIEEAFGKNGFALSGRYHTFFTKFGCEDLGIIFVQQDMWKTQRRFAARALTGSGLHGKSIEERILEEVDSLCESIQKKNGQPFILEHDLLVAITDVINGITLQAKCSCDWHHELRAYAKNVVQRFRDYGWLHALLSVLPWTRFFPYVKQNFAKLLRFRNAGRRIFGRGIEDHIKRHDPKHTKDMADLFLIEHFRNSPTFENLKQLQFLVSDLFAAGTETTTSTIRWILFYLIKLPKVQEKVHHEIEQVVGTGGKVRLNLDLPYTKAVIQEGFRIRTSTPLGVPRGTLQDVNLMGYHIPKNTQVIANLWAVHNNPNYWPEPNKFIPERHLDENGKFVKSNKVIPFSIGSRNCLGENLARSEVFLFVVSILQKFELLPNPDDPHPPEEGHVGFVYSAPHYPLIMREK